MEYFNRNYIREATDFSLFNLLIGEFGRDYILDFGHRKVRLSNIVPIEHCRHISKNKIEVDIYYNGKKLGIKEK